MKDFDSSYNLTRRKVLKTIQKFQFAAQKDLYSVPLSRSVSLSLSLCLSAAGRSRSRSVCAALTSNMSLISEARHVVLITGTQPSVTGSGQEQNKGYHHMLTKTYSPLVGKRGRESMLGEGDLPKSGFEN